MAESSPEDSSHPEQAGIDHPRKYPLYPSVVQLLHENGINAEKAAEIQATGPNGRLLKGDVLAYLGIIEPSYPGKQSARLAKLRHLDLSNIDRTTARQPSQSPQIQQKQESQPLPVDIDTEIAVPISLATVKEVQGKVHAALGIDVPLETFISRAIQVSNADLPSSASSLTSDELFDQILGLDKARPQYSRGAFRPQMIPLPSFSPSQVTNVHSRSDIIDVLTGNLPKKRSTLPLPVPASVQSTSINVFSVVVPKAEEKRGKVFLERMKSILQVDPARLIL